YAVTDDRGRDGCAEVDPCMERLLGPDQDVSRACEAGERLISPAHTTTLSGSLVGHDNQQIIVAVGSRVAARGRTEEVDAFGGEGLDEASDDLREKRIIRGGPSRRCPGRVRHHAAWRPQA